MFSLTPTRMTAAARKLALACALGAGFASMPTHAADFIELGDAGQTQGAAQTAAGTGALNNIFGSLSSSTDADLYIVDIANPGTFSATTVNAGTGSLDTQLFLLSLSGAPIFLNDEDAGGLSSGSTLPAGSFGSLAAGRYLLGVALSGFDPVNVNNQLLFAGGFSATDLRGAAGGLQPAFLGGFSDDTFFADSGSYDIQLTGVAAIPEPATNALLLAGGALGMALLRRRRAAASQAA